MGKEKKKKKRGKILLINRSLKIISTQSVAVITRKKLPGSAFKDREKEKMSEGAWEYCL